MRNYRKRMHIQPDTRTVETHRRPPDLQMWLYRSECSPASSNPRPFATRGLRPRVSLHTVYSDGAWAIWFPVTNGRNRVELLGAVNSWSHSRRRSGSGA